MTQANSAAPRKLFWYLCGFSALILSFLPMPMSVYDWTQFDLTRAVVFESRITINSFVENTLDWSRGPDGNYYSNKAPGTSLMGVPVLALASAVERPLRLEPGFELDLNLRLVRLFTIILPTLLSGLLFFKLMEYFARERPAKGYSSAFLGMLLIYGTLLLPFSVTLWTHPPAAFFLLAAFYVLVAQPLRPTLLLLGGLAAGFAILTEYTAAPMLLIFCLYLAGKELVPWRVRILRCVWFGIGALPPVFVLMLYQYSAFGNPFTTSYALVNPEIHIVDCFLDALSCQKNTLFGTLQVPSWRAAMSLLFRPDRGLLTLCPLTIAALAGWMKKLSQPAGRIRLVALWTFVYYLVVISSFTGWHGGGSPGPRYLVTPLPIVLLGLAWIEHRWYWNLLIVCGILISATIAAVPADYYSVVSLDNVFVMLYYGYWREPEHLGFLFGLLACTAGLIATTVRSASEPEAKSAGSLST